MLDFHRPLRGRRLLAIGFALSIVWAGIIFVTSVIEFNDLILWLEEYFSPDGNISYRYTAAAMFMAAPSLVMSIILMVVLTRKTWGFPIYVLYGYLFFVGVHFIFYLSYRKIVLGISHSEDSFLEWGTFACAMLASILFLISGFVRIRFAYLLSISWLIFALEEISWGQRIFNIDSPLFFETYNYQKEINLHNFLDPILRYLYICYFLLIFLFLTWFRRFQFLSKLYRMQGVSYVLDISDKFGLWLIPLFLSLFSFSLHGEFVEEQWGFFGVLLGFLLLFSPADCGSPHLIRPKISPSSDGAEGADIDGRGLPS